MYNIKSKYIVNQNDNGTLTIYDLENEQYFEINEIGGIIFNNINRDISNNNTLSITFPHIHVNIVVFIDTSYATVLFELINLILYY